MAGTEEQNAAAQEARRQDQRDAALVDRLKRGEAKALDELFRRHRDAACAVAFRMLGNREDALDTVQESFIHVMRGIEGFRGQSSFRTWLYRIVVHASLDYRRYRALRTAESLDAETALEPAADGPGQRSAPDEAIEHDLRRAIDKALTNISEKNRAALVLYALEGMSYKEVADVLNISVGTVMSRIFNARQRLRELLASEIG